MKHRHSPGLVVASIVASGVFVAGQPAFAQKEGAQESGLEEIVVTAQKRTENLQSVPIAATALTEEALQQRFIKSFTDVSAALPNASLEGEGLSNYASSFYIRGQGTQNRGPFVDPAVSVVVDGVAGGYVATALTDFMDIEAIEVLRGPQGTLQGRNSTGGAILVRHKRPDVNASSGSVGLLVGNAGRHDISGVINQPIIDGRLGLRIAAKWTEADGFFDNWYAGSHHKVNGQNRTTVLPSLAFEGENFDVTMRGTFNTYHDDSSTLIPRYACRIDPRINPNTPQNDTYVNSIATRFGGAAAVPFCARKPSESMFTIAQNRPIEGATLNQESGTLEANYRFAGAGTLTFVGNYQDNVETSALDVDGTWQQLNSNQERTHHFQQSGELRFASDFSEKFDFIAGGFYLKQHYTLTRVTRVDGTPTALTPTINTLNGGSTQNNEQSGVFVQGNVHFTDSLSGVAGARYTKDRKNIYICGTAAALCTSRYQFNKANWSDTSPRVGLNFQYDPKTFFYAYWAKGFRAGGFNGEAGTASAAGPFNPEKVRTIEAGAKFDTWENRLRLNVAIFDTKADNLQRQLSRATAAGTAEIVTQNAAAAKFKGAELEATLLPIDALRLEASIGYLDAKYTDYCTDLNGTGANDPSLVACAPAIVVTGGTIQPVNLTGLPIARTPKTTVRLAGTYTWNVGAGNELLLNAEWAHQAKEMTLDGGAPVGTTLGITNFDGGRVDPMRDPTNVINASLTWKAADDRYRVSLWGKNLGNEIYFRRLSFASPTLSFGTLANPREYGIQVDYNFGK
ncbi:MAG: TonB-dependent receptor [Steroidobacteraceae bacterium]